MWHYQKCKAKRIATTLVSAALMLAGCTTTPDGRMTIDPRIVGGAGGAALGGVACALMGGKTGTCLAAAAGGAVVGALLAQYLNPQEQQSLAQTQAQMLEASPKRTVNERWQNPDGSKSVDLTVGPQKMVKVNNVQFKERYDSNIAKVPPNALCRDTDKKLGNGKSVKVMNCRTKEGNWMEVGETA